MTTSEPVAPPPRVERAETPRMIDLMAWYYILRENFLFIAAFAAVCVGLAVFYLKHATPIFTAQCVVQVEQEAQVMSGKFAELLPEDFKTLEALKTVEGALESRSLSVRVVKANKLDVDDPDFRAREGQPPLTDADLADIMGRKVDASLRRGTRLIDIKVDDEDPNRAVRLANSLVEEYIKQTDEQKAEATRLANESLFRQRDELKAKLESSEQTLQAYREKYGAMFLEMQPDGKQTVSLQNVTGDKLKELNRQLQEARGERIKLEGFLPLLKQAQDAKLDDLLSIEPVAKATDVVELQKLLAAKEAEFGDVRNRYLELHPKYQQITSQITDIRSALERAARKAAQGVLASHESALTAEQKLQAALTDEERSGVELTRVAIPFNVLLRDTQADRALYDQVSARVREIELSNELGKRNVRVIQVPDVPVDPSKPKKMLILALALGLGVFLPTLLVILSHAFNTTLRSVDEAEHILNLPSLATVPQASGKAARNPLILINQPASREAEAFRCLRTSLTLSRKPNEKTVLVTSAVPAEGKSYCASNYAVALAQQRLRTLLIDADLRRPGLGRYFAASAKARGLSEVLSGKATFDEAVQGTDIENLFVMPAGLLGSNPAELLGSEAVAQVLRTAEERFDRVIVDAAPVNAVTDTLLLVDKVSSVVLVVRARRTKTRVLLRALRHLRLAKAPLVGFVLNRLPSRLANYYYFDEGSYTSAGVYGTA